LQNASIFSVCRRIANLMIRNDDDADGGGGDNVAVVLTQ